MKVVVIGAGPSGIAYTKYMEKHGHEVIVLEANEEIGGRTRSVEFAGGRYPMGATYDHHSETTEYFLQYPRDVPYINLEPLTDRQILTSDNHDISKEISELLTKVMRYQEDHESGYVESPIEKACRETSNTRVSDFLRRLMLLEECDGVPSSQFKKANKPEGYIGQYAVEGAKLSYAYVGTGMHDRLKFEASNLKDIRVGCLVTGIEQSDVKPVVTYKCESEEVKLQADHVHVAVPAAVVNRISFSPKLTPLHQESISSVITSKSIRVLLDYDERVIEESEVGSKYNKVIFADSKDFGMVLIENRPAIEEQCSTVSIILFSDAAESGGEIIKNSGQKVFEEKIISFMKEKIPALGDPTDILVKFWEEDRTAQGAWASQHNREQRIAMIKPFGKVTFSGDYLGFDCKRNADGTQKCIDFSGAVHGAVLSGIHQAKLTHTKYWEERDDVEYSCEDASTPQDVCVKALVWNNLTVDEFL